MEWCTNADRRRLPQVVTLEGWSGLMYAAADASGGWGATLYFPLLVWFV